MKTASETAAGVKAARTWKDLPPVVQLEVRQVGHGLAEALDELAAAIATASPARHETPRVWVPEQDPAVCPNAPSGALLAAVREALSDVWVDGGPHMVGGKALVRLARLAGVDVHGGA